jgi:hypothetical protein
VTTGGFEPKLVLSRKFGDLSALAMGGEVVLCREFANELLVLIGCDSAKLVIEVSDFEDNAKFWRQLKQDPEQPHGISSAGDGDADSVSGA